MNTDSEVMDLSEVTTHNGTIRIGDHFHDKAKRGKNRHRRWLRIDRIESDRYAVTCHYTVVLRQHSNGWVTGDSTVGTTRPDKLLGPNFVRTTAPTLTVTTQESSRA